MASRKQQLLTEMAQTEMAEHSTRLGLEHLRNAATLYELAGRGYTAQTIRRLITVIRKQAFLQPAPMGLEGEVRHGR